MYYLLPLPGSDPQALQWDILRAYTTSQRVINDAWELHRSRKFLLHMPYFYFRSILAATCVINMVLRSSYAEVLDMKQEEQLVASCISLCRDSSVVENDLPIRLGGIMQGVWNKGFSHLARWEDLPLPSFTRRLGASICFDCMRRWKEDLSEDRPKSRPPPADGTEPSVVLPVDPLTNFDWSFMDDFDWSFEPNLLVPVS